MFSFIVCSIKPEETKALEQNIAATVGVPYEYISFDNRKFQYGLTKVYNLCARKARYDYLCFLHEDVRFLSEGWGKEISAQLSKENCGVIGFAGSTVKLKSSAQWAVSKQTTRIHLIQQMRFGKEKQVENNPDKNDFSPVITLDGLCLFVKRSGANSIRRNDIHQLSLLRLGFLAFRSTTLYQLRLPYHFDSPFFFGFLFAGVASRNKKAE